MAPSEADGAQQHWLRRLPDLVPKKRRVQCDICGETFLLERAIVRENETLCDQCYDEKYPSKKK